MVDHPQAMSEVTVQKENHGHNSMGSKLPRKNMDERGYCATDCVCSRRRVHVALTRLGCTKWKEHNHS